MSIFSQLEQVEALHPIHISKCQIEHDIDSRHLQITLHVFIDDLELKMKENGMDSLYLGTEFESADADRLVGKYIQEHFRIVVDNEVVELQFLGKEMTDDYAAFWCYFESDIPINQSNMQVAYDLLMDLHEDQKNILNFIRLNRSEAYELLHRDKRIVDIKM
jgi:hypothetical protein